MHSSIAAELGTTPSTIEHKAQAVAKPETRTAHRRASSGQAFRSSSPSLSLGCVGERRRGAVLRQAESRHVALLFRAHAASVAEAQNRDPNNPDRDPPACCPAKISTALIS